MWHHHSMPWRSDLGLRVCWAWIVLICCNFSTPAAPHLLAYCGKHITNIISTIELFGNVRRYSNGDDAGGDAASGCVRALYIPCATTIIRLLARCSDVASSALLNTNDIIPL